MSTDVVLIRHQMQLSQRSRYALRSCHFPADPSQRSRKQRLLDIRQQTHQMSDRRTSTAFSQDKGEGEASRCVSDFFLVALVLWCIHNFEFGDFWARRMSALMLDRSLLSAHHHGEL